jgi:hypothetical protein
MTTLAKEKKQVNAESRYRNKRNEVFRRPEVKSDDINQKVNRKLTIEEESERVGPK